MGAPPPPHVLAAFGVRADTELIPLAGGLEQTAWRADGIVVKPVQAANAGEGEWIATVLDVIVEDGFRVIKPVRADDGRWLEDGWAAWHWLEGHHERGEWADVLAGARAFHQALPDAIATAGVDALPAWLDARGHRWAYAESTVWHGAPFPPTVNQGQIEHSLYARAVALGPPMRDSERVGAQVIHGDIASNVLRLVDGSGHAFIDMSPGWRTAASVDAQIAVEAVTWFRAPDALLDGFEPADLARACAFRLLCGLQASADWATEFPGELEAWTRTLDVIGA